MTHSSWVRSTGSTVFKLFMFSPIDCLVARGTSPNIPRNGQLNQFNQNSSEPPPPYPIIAANVTNLIQNRQSPTQSNTTSTTGSSSNYDGHTFTGHYDSHMNYCKFRSNTTKWPVHLTIAVYHFFLLIVYVIVADYRKSPSSGIYSAASAGSPSPVPPSNSISPHPAISRSTNVCQKNGIIKQITQTWSRL